MSIAVVGNVAGDSLPVETDTAYQKMVKTALVDTGNNYRLKTVIEKIKKGKKVYIAKKGDNVTEGAGPQDFKDGYA